MQVLYLSETEQEDHKYVEENEGKMNRYLSKIVVVAGTNASGKALWRLIWPKNMEVKSSQQIQGRFIKALIYAAGK